MQRRYEKARKANQLSGHSCCPMCQCMKLEKIKDCGLFYLAKNEFYYDKVATRHDMIVLKAHKKCLNLIELIVLHFLKKRMEGQGTYNHYRENFGHQKSIKNHWHAHLILEKK